MIKGSNPNQIIVCDICNKECNKYEGFRLSVTKLENTNRVTVSGNAIKVLRSKLNKHLCEDCYYKFIRGCIWFRQIRRKIIKQVLE